MKLVSSVNAMLGCLFLQESSGFLFFPLLWHFFQRNHDSCSTVTFSEPPQETCLCGAYVESYVGYQFVRQKTEYDTILWYSTMASVHHHCCAASTIAALPLLRRHHHCHPHRCATIAIAIAAPPLPSLRHHLLCHHCTHCCAATMETGDDDNGDDDGDDD
jgi:hypothetical protein